MSFSRKEVDIGHLEHWNAELLDENRALKAQLDKCIHRTLQNRLKAAERGDAKAIENLRWMHWTIGRKLLALGITPFDPKTDNPEA